jgi:hypothetical protein
MRRIVAVPRFTPDSANVRCKLVSLVEYVNVDGDTVNAVMLDDSMLCEMVGEEWLLGQQSYWKASSTH